MSYAKSYYERYYERPHHFMPLNVFRTFHAICAAFDTIEAFDEEIAQEIWICFSAIAKKLPKEYKPSEAEFNADAFHWYTDEATYERQPSVPLHDLLPVPACIQLIHAFFCEGPIRDRGLFAALRRKLFLNEASYHGVSLIAAQRGQTPDVADLDDDPEVLINKFLGGTPFCHLFSIPVPFKISKKALSEHCFIVAKPGHGKTQLLGSFVAQFLNDPEKPGLFCLDPAGDWFEKIRDRVPPERLVVLDPETDPPPLNFFDFKNSTEAATMQSFQYLMSSLSGGLSDKQGALVPYLLKLLRQIPDASLETLRQIVDEKVKRIEQSAFHAYISMLPNVDQGFFHNQFYHSSMDPTKQAIAWKIYSAMSSDAFREMFGATHNSFDAHAAMRERKVVLARGSELTLGEHGLSVFLQYVIGQFLLAALARARMPKGSWHQCYLLCDEAKHIYNHQVERLLTECRKWGLSLFTATQVIDQIPTEVKAAIYGATSIKAAGNVSFSDANILAREMRTNADFIQRMKTFEWAFFIADSDKAMKVHVPPGALEAMPKYSPPSQPVQPAPPPAPIRGDAFVMMPEKQRGDTETVSPSQPVYASAGVDQTSNTVPQEPKHTTNVLSQLELVRDASGNLEKLLETKLKATGRGLHEKVKSVEHLLPPYLIRPAFFVAEMRNKSVHNKGFNLPHPDKFFAAVKLLEDHFAAKHAADDASHIETFEE